MQPMTVVEVADYLKMSKQTIYRLVKEEGLPAYRPHARRGMRFYKEEVDTWLKSHKVEQP